MHKNRSLQDLADRALSILQMNDLGTWTKPSPTLYPHQWNWDSGFIAIGLSHNQQERAQTELLTLLSGQWANGMIPHILFNSQPMDYHPGPEYWQTKDTPLAPSRLTSGITQPPMLAMAALEVYRNASNLDSAKDFLNAAYPGLCAQSDFLLNSRDPLGCGLAFICHPWESGMDNSSAWDLPLNRFELDMNVDFKRRDTLTVSSAQRPTDLEYTRYSYLVKKYGLACWDQRKLFELRLFTVESVLFNTIMIAGLEALVEIGRILDLATEVHQAQLNSCRYAFDKYLWSSRESTYLDLDLSTGTHIGHNNISQFLALYAGIPDPQRGQQLIDKMCSDDFWPEKGWGITTQSRTSPLYESQRYWRGPVWVNTNWMIIRGLERYGKHDLASCLARDTLALVSKHGFWEYFDPESGKGLGTDNFSWTAALVLDLLAAGYA